MGRLTYVCATCEEHFTRKTSATRHNLTIHNNRGEIVSLLEYLVGRSSRRYHASNPFWFRRHREKGMHRFARATTVADSIGDTFRPPGLQQQWQYQPHQEPQRYHGQHQALSPPAVPAIQDASPYPAEQTYQSDPMNTTDEEETTTLSQETILKIRELKRLVYKYPLYHYNPGAVIACIIHFCNDGDNTLLDEKLEQLRMIDSAMGYPRM
jgi:hypothetical protein